MSQIIDSVHEELASLPNACENHPETLSIGRCIDCGVYVCEDCQRRDEGYIYCLPCTERRSAGLDQNTVLIFWIVLGGFGGHRFYTGHILIGMLQLFTLGGLGIWTFYDLYLILTGKFKDDEGRLLIDRS